MRDDFCVLILTHGRPNHVHTYDQLRNCGYDGKIYLVIDDEDKTAPQYIERYGDEVLTFNKSEMAKRFDEGDNLDGHRGVVYARNASFGLAKSVGCKYFMQLDDDYTSFYYRIDEDGNYCTWTIKRTIGKMIDVLLDYYESIPALSLCISQGGDWIGGGSQMQARQCGPYMKRKAMNTFLCSTDRPFDFSGRINEDVNAYVELGRKGGLFFTVMQAQVRQKQTQTRAAGMTDLYLDSGTYLKSFYSVMYAPSCVKVATLTDHQKGSNHSRMHHQVNWGAAVPLILREDMRKGVAGGR